MRNLWREMFQSVFAFIMVASFLASLGVLLQSVEHMTLDYMPWLLVSIIGLIFGAMGFVFLD